MIIVAVALAAMFAFAAGAKLADPEDARAAFTVAGASWGLVPAVLAELAVAVALPLWPRAGAAGSLALLLIFSVGLTRLAGAGDDVSCHCFGNLGDGSVGPRTFLRNGGFAAAALVLFIFGAPSTTMGMAVPVVALAAGGLIARRPRRLTGLDAGVVVFVDDRCGPCHLLRAQVADWPLRPLPAFVEDPQQAQKAGVRGTPGAVRLDGRGRIRARALGAPAIEALARNLTVSPERTYEAFGVLFAVSGPLSPGLLPPGTRRHTGAGPPLAHWTLVGNALYRDGRLDCRRADGLAPTDRLEVEIRHLVAEHAPDHAFIHAGVVAWRGEAIIIPGPSYTGKSTLVAALLGAGASYLSDEYAVLDAHGRVHAYPKPVSLRPAPGSPAIAHDPRALGDEPVVRSPMPVGAIVSCPYDPDVGNWEGTRRSAGNAAMMLVANAVGIRQAPARVMAAIGAASQDAIVLAGVRGEADEAAEALIRELDREPASAPA